MAITDAGFSCRIAVDAGFQAERKNETAFAVTAHLDFRLKTQRSGGGDRDREDQASQRRLLERRFARDIPWPDRGRLSTQKLQRR